MNIVEPIRSLEHIKKIRCVLRLQSLRNELLFVLGINTGLRVSDILSLKFSDILKPNKSLKEYVVINEKKTSKTKKFYLGDIVREVVSNILKKNTDITLEDYIFKSRQGNNTPLSRQQAYNILNGAGESIGIVERGSNGKIVAGEIGTHTLRKTFGYFAHKNNVPLELLMNLFNHSSITQTLKYIGITEQQKKDVYLKSNLG